MKAKILFLILFVSLPYALISRSVEAMSPSSVSDAHMGFHPLGIPRAFDIRQVPKLTCYYERSSGIPNVLPELNLTFGECEYNSTAIAHLADIEDSSDLYQVFLKTVSKLARTVGDNSGSMDVKTLLEKTAESVKKKREISTVYDFHRHQFESAGRNGIFNTLIEEDYEDPFSNEASKTRKISISMDMSDSEFYSALTLGRSGLATCPLSAAWPLQWLVSSKNSEKALSINVMAVPIDILEDGSYRLPSTPEKVSLEVLAKTNQVFFEQNGWTMKERVQESTTSKTSRITGFKRVTEFFLQVPNEDTLNCSASYFLRECGLFSSTKREQLCSRWQRLCGVKTTVKLDKPTRESHTHIAYIPAKLFGGDLDLDKDAEKRRYYETIRAHDIARGSAIGLSRVALANMFDRMQTSEIVYVPQLRPKQDSLTVTVVVLVWFSEWIFGAIYFLGWLRELFVNRSCFVGAPTTVFSYKEMTIKFRRGCFVMVPAVVGYVPLLLGLAHASSRHNAVVGIMGVSWSKTSYRAFVTSEPSFDENRGRVLSMVAQYVERSQFSNFYSVYLPTACIITLLMLFSVCVIVAKGIQLWRARPRNAAEQGDSEFDEAFCRARGIVFATGGAAFDQERKFGAKESMYLPWVWSS